MKIINDELVQLDGLTETDIDELSDMVSIIPMYNTDRAYVPLDQWELVDPQIRGFYE